VTGVQENGGIDLIFHTNLFSGKTMDLTVHPTETNMSFLDPTNGSWASVSGTASILADPATVQKYYTPALKAWLGDLGDGVHDGGPTDPRIGVIRVEAKAATYAIARKGLIGRAVETGKAVAKGDTPQINKIRELGEGELAECEFSLFLFFFVSFGLMLVSICVFLGWSLTCLSFWQLQGVELIRNKSMMIC
jgi:general stress protein 26